MIDFEKRARVMGRSIKLGRCICNPKEPCPCDLFKRKNVCLCSGEREDDAAEDAPLTQFVENAGCASKIGREDLRKALAGLPRVFDRRVLVSAETCDDAGVYKLGPALALVQTVDVFTPCVDDAYLFGRIAAANSVSDVYAMGGRPLTALSIVAFPIEKLSPRVMNRMLQGGIDALREAGTVVVGGHSLKDKEIKFGFAVTGVVHPKKIVTNAAARPGDSLILTKPLGTGAICFAAQIGKARPAWIGAAGRSMTALNRGAAEVMTAAGVRCATDVTGFGLAGHLGEISVQSGVTAEVWANALPVFPGVLGLLRDGVISGAVERNREAAARRVERADDVGQEFEDLLYDPQTSGGLLMCVPEAKAARVLARLRAKGAVKAAIIGRITRKSEGKIVLAKSPHQDKEGTASSRRKSATPRNNRKRHSERSKESLPPKKKVR
jgi:selenide,water dikinase